MRFYSFVFLLSFCACNSLQPAQTNNVKSFARSARLLSDMPGRLYRSVADYRHQLKMIEVATVHRPEKLVEELNRVADINRRFQSNAAQVHSAMGLIDAYAECLLALTDARYANSLGKQGDELSLQLTTAFTTYNKLFNRNLPPSVGNFIGGVVTQIGSVKLRGLQKKYLRSFVDSGAVVITAICDYYSGTVAGTLQTELASLNTGLANVMLHFYANVYEYQKQQAVNSFDYLKLYNPLYMEMREKLQELQGMETKTVAAMQQVKTAHQGLQGIVDSAPSGQLLTEVKDLYAAAIECRALLNKK